VWSCWIIFGSFWNHFGVTLGSLWGHFGVTLGLLWGHFGITLGSLWDQFAKANPPGRPADKRNPPPRASRKRRRKSTPQGTPADKPNPPPQGMGGVINTKVRIFGADEACPEKNNLSRLSVRRARRGSYKFGRTSPPPGGVGTCLFINSPQ